MPETKPERCTLTVTWRTVWWSPLYLGALRAALWIVAPLFSVERTAALITHLVRFYADHAYVYRVGPKGRWRRLRVTDSYDIRIVA